LESVYKRYQRQATDRNLSFTLSLEEFEKLVSGACVFCGEQPALSVDRKDSRIGYLPFNVQSMCSYCNRLKSNDVEYIFLDQVLKIAKHIKQKQELAKLQKQKSAA
jgi:hypothetical protein